MDSYTPGRVALVLLLFIFVLMILLPLAYPYGSFVGLDGKAGMIDNWSRLSFADPITRGVYFLGDLFCHQEISRSFIINGSQMAFCQRDVSVLGGIILGLFVTDKCVGLHVKNRFFLTASLVMIVTTFIEWGVEYSLGTDMPAARIVTGILSGAGIAFLFQYAVAREYEKVMGFEKYV
jgi:uncharacterized membrane protein